jgi:hypothetical protein
MIFETADLTIFFVNVAKEYLRMFKNLEITSYIYISTDFATVLVGQSQDVDVAIRYTIDIGITMENVNAESLVEMTKLLLFGLRLKCLIDCCSYIHSSRIHSCHC